MGHYGKHIIDPETGLCEICDKDAIRQVRQGKRPRRQVYYSDRDDDLTYRSNDEIIHIQVNKIYFVISYFSLLLS